jgi:hypothetical protein
MLGKTLNVTVLVSCKKLHEPQGSIVMMMVDTSHGFALHLGTFWVNVMGFFLHQHSGRYIISQCYAI